MESLLILFIWAIKINENGNVLLITAAVLAALIAGLFYAYSCSGGGRVRVKLPDSEYLKACRASSGKFLTLFFVDFMGAAILLQATAFLFLN